MDNGKLTMKNGKWKIKMWKMDLKDKNVRFGNPRKK